MAIDTPINGCNTHSVVHGKWSKKITCAALSFIVLSTVLSCASIKPLAPETGDGENRASVLVASRSSDFKQTLIDRLAHDYKNKIELTVIPLGDIFDMQTTEYDALVVMGERMGWLLYSAKERRFLRHFKEPQKLIMVMTAAKDDWEWERDDDIDVITGASAPDNLDPLYQEVTTRLDAILNSGPTGR
jgi:hypothetical protein